MDMANIMTGRDAGEGDTFREALGLSEGQAAAWGLFVAAEAGKSLGTAATLHLVQQGLDEMIELEGAILMGRSPAKGNPIDWTHALEITNTRWHSLAWSVLAYTVRYDTRDSRCKGIVGGFCNVGEPQNARLFIDWLGDPDHTPDEDERARLVAMAEAKYFEVVPT